MLSLLATWLTLLVLSCLIPPINPAPVAIDLYQICSAVICKHGSARLDTDTNTCVCPKWIGEDLSDPCEYLSCPFGQQPAFSFLTNQCTCETICALQECKGQEISIYSFALGSCGCVLDCPALIHCPGNTRAEYDFESHSCFCESIPEEERDWVKFHETLEAEFQARQVVEARPGIGARDVNATSTMSVAAPTATPTLLPANGTSAANFTYIPPPNIDITSALIQQALSDQFQTTATIGGVKTYFLDGIISFQVQLAGLVAATLPMNASTSIPCGSMGTDPESSLVVVPRAIKDGTPQVTLTSCLVIAVNVYSPDHITYWVQLDNGTLISILSDNKVHHIDLIEPNAAAQLTILTTPVGDLSRRDLSSAAPDDLTKRGMEEINPYTAKMTPEACAAMTCNNNGGEAPFYHPFLETCYCQTKEYVEVNPSGEGSLSSK